MNWKKILCTMLLMLLASLSVGTASSSEINYEDYPNPTKMFVTANLLDGRANPRKTGFIEARFDYGDELTATGNWSEDHRWIEVIGGETGVVWVNIQYVSENKHNYKVKNEFYKTVKIRSRPFDGKITGYVRKGKTIEITQVVLGWGKCKKGWVELRYLEETD